MQEKIVVELTPLQIEIINHLISNELIVNKNAVGILLMQKKPTTPDAIKSIKTQESQLKALQKIFKKGGK